MLLQFDLPIDVNFKNLDCLRATLVNILTVVAKLTVKDEMSSEKIV